MSNYREQPLIALEEYKAAGEPSEALRVALVSSLYPGVQGDVTLKSAQTVLQHLQTTVGQSEFWETIDSPKPSLCIYQIKRLW